MYQIKDLTIDLSKHQILLGEQEVHFTQNEFKIIELLAQGYPFLPGEGGDGAVVAGRQRPTDKVADGPVVLNNQDGLFLEEDWAVVEVRDRGRGLSEEVLQAIQAGRAMPLSGDATRGMGKNRDIPSFPVKAGMAR